MAMTYKTVMLNYIWPEDFGDAIKFFTRQPNDKMIGLIN